jgi:hypothetical protein
MPYLRSSFNRIIHKKIMTMITIVIRLMFCLHESFWFHKNNGDKMKNNEEKKG